MSRTIVVRARAGHESTAGRRRHPEGCVEAHGRRSWLGVRGSMVLTCPPLPSTNYVSPRQRFEYSNGVDPNSELCGLSSLVVPPPDLDPRSRFDQVPEPVLVEAFLAEAPVETFDVGVLGRLARPDESAERERAARERERRWNRLRAGDPGASPRERARARKTPQNAYADPSVP